MQTNIYGKSNSAWNQLCDLTTKLANEAIAIEARGGPKFKGRPHTFQAACRERPDLAASAIGPTGEPVPAWAATVDRPQPHVSAPVQSEGDSAMGTALPWREVLARAGCLRGDVGSDAPRTIASDRPHANTPGQSEESSAAGTALPWREVLRGLENEKP